MGLLHAQDRLRAAEEHDPAVLSLIKSEIDERGTAFKGYERPVKFVVANEDFTTENGMLTPTLKLKRRKVLEKWGSALEKLYEISG